MKNILVEIFIVCVSFINIAVYISILLLKYVKLKIQDLDNCLRLCYVMFISVTVIN